jgi:hypothetical protein
MKNIIRYVVFTFIFTCICNTTFAQTEVYKNSDSQSKEALYKKHKKEAQSFDKNDFDTLFFEFFQKQKDENSTLTKEEFYSYSIKIAIYSEKLGLLYKDQKKNHSEQNKNVSIKSSRLFELKNYKIKYP